MINQIIAYWQKKQKQKNKQTKAIIFYPPNPTPRTAKPRTAPYRTLPHSSVPYRILPYRTLINKIDSPTETFRTWIDHIE